MIIEAPPDRPEEQHASVFISYSREDKDFVRRLDAALTKRERETWVDLEDIRPIEEWLASVYSGIEDANAFVFVISPESVRSKSCLQELAHAVEHNKRLVPIVRREVDDETVPEPLGSYNWIFFRDSDDFENSIQVLIDALDTDLDWVRAHTRLLTRAIEWDENGRDTSFVLRGSDLQTAEEWQARAVEKEPRLTALQTEYVLASRRATTRRQRVTLGAVTFGLVVALALGLFAWLSRNEAIQQRNEAERQANISLGRQLAAQAGRMSSEQKSLLPRAVLLGVEAMRRFPSREADQALREGLALLPRRDPTLVNHEDDVESVAFSPSGKYLATAGLDGTARVWETATGKEVATMNHEGEVQSVVFSPSGKYLATASWDNTARVWETATGEEVGIINHEDDVYSVAFSPSGKYVATASKDNTAQVWEAATGEEVGIMNHEDFVESVAFSPSGKYVATGTNTRPGSGGATAEIWFWRPEDLIDEACSRVTRNLTRDEWRLYLGNEPYRKTCPNLPEKVA